MNIFVLDLDPKLCAQYHCDRHVGKMIIESCQLLSAAHWRLNPKADKIKNLCKPTHMNHPCAQWVRESSDNYYWLLDLYQSLHDEFMYRYGKAHNNYIHRIGSVMTSPPLLESQGLTPFALAMDDRFKIQGDAGASLNEALLLAVASYRNYYKHGKQHLHKWTRRDKPEWL